MHRLSGGVWRGDGELYGLAPADAEQGRAGMCGHAARARANLPSLNRVTRPSTVGSASMRAIAASTCFSWVWCVSRMMSVWVSPSPGSFCSIASIEMVASARMRVMSASTPSLSATRMHR